MALRVPRWVLLSLLVKIAQGSLDRRFLSHAKSGMLGVEAHMDTLRSDCDSLAEVAIPIFWLPVVLLVDSTLPPFAVLSYTVV